MAPFAKRDALRQVHEEPLPITTRPPVESNHAADGQASQPVSRLSGEPSALLELIGRGPRVA
jgi:hypothetical protein